MSARDNPREIERHSKSDDSDDKPMSTDTSDAASSASPTTDSIADELNTILAGDAPLEGLQAEHQGGLDYLVLSARNGAPSVHHVHLGNDPTCTCKDKQINRDDREPCAHIVKAMLADRMSFERSMAQMTLESLQKVNDAVERAETAADALEDARIRQLSNNPDHDESADTPSKTDDGNPVTPSERVDPGEKADELQAAFDDTMSDQMDVQAHDGVVWVQTKRDAKDWVFDSWVRDPDPLEYDPDGEDYEKPGEWWKNYIEPGHVETYIEGVLA